MSKPVITKRRGLWILKHQPGVTYQPRVLDKAREAVRDLNAKAARLAAQHDHTLNMQVTSPQGSTIHYTHGMQNMGMAAGLFGSAGLMGGHNLCMGSCRQLGGCQCHMIPSQQQFYIPRDRI